MANTIRIKRSTTSNVPTSLENAEVAFSEGNQIMYYGIGTGGGNGSATSIEAIAGAGAFTTLGTAQTISGVKTFSGATILGTPASGNLSNCTGTSLTAGVSGILPVANGGTGSASGVPLTTGVSGILPVASGGTGFSTLASAGIALRGANSDITSLTGLTTALTVAQGGTGVTTSTGTGAGVHAASPTFTGTIGCDAITSTGNIIVGGNLTVNGTTTTINSTTTTIDDPTFTLGGDTAPTADDNKDRGIEFRWHNGTAAKIGFFGFDDSTGYMTFIPEATNTSEVFSGTLGDFQATNFRGSLIGNASTVTNGLYTTSTIDGGTY